MSAHANAVASPLRRLPVVTLYATDRCNSRCVTCDYWRHGKLDMSIESVERLLPSFKQFGTRIVLLSGGEPLINPQWPAIAQRLRDNGMRVWLLTSGLSLAKHARRAAPLFDAITVSLDGTDRNTYAAIRGLDAFDPVCEGIRRSVASGRRPGIRVTVQRSNYRQLAAFVELAQGLGAGQVSFLAVDIANPHAFGRTDEFAADLALRAADLPQLAAALEDLERRFMPEFRSGFIAESPQKLRRILQYFTAILARGPYPPIRCNAPEFSVVIGTDGRLQPCFFIAGPSDAVIPPIHQGSDLSIPLNGPSMMNLRAAIRAGERPECKTCVCSLWGDPEKLEIVMPPVGSAVLGA